MSRLIKSERLVEAQPKRLVEPRLIEPRLIEPRPAIPAPAGAKPDPEAVRMQEELQAELLFERCRQDALERGFAEGSAAGRIQAELRIAGERESAQRRIDEENARMQKALSEQEGATRNEALDFAFGLASKILNVEIDRTDRAYAFLFDNHSEVEDKETVTVLGQLLTLPEEDFSLLLERMDMDSLSVVLKAADKGLSSAFLQRMEEKARGAVCDEMMLLGRIGREDLRLADEKIRGVLYALEINGQIHQNRGGSAVVEAVQES